MWASGEKLNAATESVVITSIYCSNYRPILLASFSRYYHRTDNGRRTTDVPTSATSAYLASEVGQQC